MGAIHSGLISLVFLCASILLPPLSLSAATLHDYLTPIRSQIVTSLSAASNSAPIQKGYITILQTGLRTIDRPGATNLLNDIKILNHLTVALTKPAVSNRFDVLLDDAITEYFSICNDWHSDLFLRLSASVPSTTANSAWKKLDQNSALAMAVRTEPILLKAVQNLGKMAANLKSAEAIVQRAEAVVGTGNILTAKVDGRRFTVKGVSGVRTTVGLRVDVYRPYLISFHAVHISGGGARLLGTTIDLMITDDLRQGNSFYVLGSDDARCTITTPYNSQYITAEFGYLDINVDLANGTIQGYFNFGGRDLINSDSTFHSMQGHFFAKLP